MYPFPVIDLHADISSDIIRRRSLGEHHVLETQHLAKLRAGSVVSFITPIWVETQYKPDRSIKRALQIVGALYDDLDESSSFQLIRNQSDFTEAISSQKIAIILGAEGGEFIEDDISLLRDFYRLGMRCFGFVWNQRNLLADGWDHRADDRGLSDLGREVVKELSRLGIVIDLSHIAPKSFWDVMDLASKPVIVSHCATIVHSALRELTDEQLRAMADNRGVVGIFALSWGETKNLRTFCDHIEHAIKIAGPDHVGLGPDFYDYIQDQLSEEPVPHFDLMSGLEDHTKLNAVIAELQRRKVGEEDIKKITFGNFERVFRQVVK
jgi:membrane dipeptidase